MTELYNNHEAEEVAEMMNEAIDEEALLDGDVGELLKVL
jgi:hypothetical protein